MKHTKYLRIYHHDHFSYRNLIKKPMFNFLEEIKSQNELYKVSLLESLVYAVRDFNIHDRLSPSELFEELKYYIEETEINNDITIPNTIKTKFIEYFSKVYYSKNYVDKFRGDVVEYFAMQYIKKPYKKIYHEPDFYNKRKKIPSGNNCLVDIVTVNPRKAKFKLIECKANLNNEIRHKKINHKLDYMDSIERELVQYVDDSQQNVTIKKILISLITPSLTLPSKRINYQVIELFTLFRVSPASFII